MAREIEALRRGMRVLDLLGEQGPIGLSELARRASLPKATVLRVLVTLAATGHARQVLADGRWEARAAPARTGEAPSRLAAVAGPVLDRLCAEMLWPSDIGVFERGAMRVLETSRRRSPFVINRDVMGARIHVMFSAMGRAILAGLDDDGRAALVVSLRRDGDPRDQAACTDAAVERLVAETRARGYAVRETGYYATTRSEGGVSAIALPVMSGGRAIAAVNLCWVTGAIPADAVRSTYLPRLRAAAAEIARA